MRALTAYNSRSHLFNNFASSLNIFCRIDILFYFCSRKMNNKKRLCYMEIISKILMTILSFVVQIIEFVILLNMACFAVICIFFHSNKSKTAYSQSV